ncbi:MAG: peptide chain release factor 2, partial [Eubacteriales bacterium]|nr:peptide chain release factor 2 [Eubacteriales bacterium]
MSPFDLAGLEAKLDIINSTMEAEGFWDDHEKAHKLLKEKKQHDTKVDGYKNLVSEFEDVKILIAMAEEEGEASLVPEIEEAYKS